MTRGLRRFHQSRQSHFLTFSCYHRQPKFNSPEVPDLFLECLESMRDRFAMRIYGYVIMPEHVHLLVGEPDQGTLAEAMHFLKLSFAKRLNSMVQKRTVPRVSESTVPQVRGRSVTANLGHTDGRINKLPSAPFWQKRYYDRNVRDEDEFIVKLRYLHRNPVARGLVKSPAGWNWSSFRHYARREKGPVEIESQWTATDRETKSGPPRIFLNPG
jgi:REP-associated tyrosine transposase